MTAGQWRRGDERRVRLEQRVRLGDVTPRRRLRLDAVARYLQDVASDDGDDADLPAGRGWILRRVDLDVDRLPSLAENVTLETRCTGLGPGSRWAERTTGIVDAADITVVTSRAIWVYVDLTTLAPRALPPEFFEVYGDAVREHRVRARLTLPELDPGATRAPWPLRRTDIDVYRHVNNANYWAAVEEWLGGPGGRPSDRRRDDRVRSRCRARRSLRRRERAPTSTRPRSGSWSTARRAPPPASSSTPRRPAGRVVA